VLFLNSFPFNSFLSKYLVVRARDVRLSRSVVLYKQLVLVSRVSITSGSELEGIQCPQRPENHFELHLNTGRSCAY
jgi:hypothetical protein